jgi:hypothetical protein
MKPLAQKPVLQESCRWVAIGRNGWMTKSLAHRDAFRDAAPADIYESMRNAIDHQLQHGVYERLDTDYIHGAIANAPQISGAIFLSLHPRQLTLLIADARVSIVLAIQRHLDNEQYRRRLAKEFHYRALQPHLSETFRLLMVPPSNLKKHCHPGRRKPSLAMTYQAEIEKLESKYLAACQHRLVDVMYGSCLRMRG